MPHAPTQPAHRKIPPLLRAWLRVSVFAALVAMGVHAQGTKHPVVPGATADTGAGKPLQSAAAPVAVPAPASAETSVDSTPPKDSLHAAAEAGPEAHVAEKRDSILVLSPRFWKKSRFDLYEVSEKELARVLWRMSGRDGSLEPDRYQVLMFTDSVRHAYLLREGTEVGKLPDTALPLLRQKIRAGALSRGGSTALWRNFWNPADPLQPYLWPTGLEVRAGFAGTAVRKASPEFERQYDLVFLQRPLPWIATEIGGHLSAYAGGLSRNIDDPLDQNPNRSYWSGTSPWWHVAVGVPGIKWEVALANRVFPEFYWLDPRGGEGSYKAGRGRAGFPVDPADTNEQFRDGVVMREWSQGGDPIPSRGNLTQSLHLKAGGLSYSAYFDSDIYRSVIQRAFFGDLPAPFGTWGFGFITANGSGHTLLRLDIAPTRIGLGRSEAGNYLRILFLRVDAAYRDPNTFRIGLSSSVLLDSRTFRPGDSR